jgi:hypothetical protein
VGAHLERAAFNIMYRLATHLLTSLTNLFCCSPLAHLSRQDLPLVPTVNWNGYFPDGGDAKQARRMRRSTQ